MKHRVKVDVVTEKRGLFGRTRQVKKSRVITVSGEQYRKMKQEKWNREMSEEERQVALLLMWEEEVADLIDR